MKLVCGRCFYTIPLPSVDAAKNMAVHEQEKHHILPTLGPASLPSGIVEELVDFLKIVGRIEPYTYLEDWKKHSLWKQASKEKPPCQPFLQWLARQLLGKMGVGW